MSDDPPRESSPPPPPPPTIPPRPPLPPLLDYPTRPTQIETETGTERWADFFRALLIVFGSIALLFFSTFGLCGLLGRGCG